jgi:hypothetical protein
MTTKVIQAIESLYQDSIPLMKFLQFKPGFKIPMPQLAIMLMAGQPATPDDSSKMLQNSQQYIEMLIAAEVLSVARPDKGAVETSDEPVKIIIAGEKFETFQKEIRDYCDTDAILIRTLGISRQAFDEISNEYRAIVAGSDNIDSILAAWEELEPDVKAGIVRGVLLQRSIMAEILLTFRARTLPIIKHSQETMAWITDLLGSENQEPAKHELPR